MNFAAQKNIDAISHVVVFFSCSQFIVRFWMEKDIVKVWNMAHLDQAEIELKNKTKMVSSAKTVTSTASFRSATPICWSLYKL